MSKRNRPGVRRVNFFNASEPVSLHDPEAPSTSGRALLQQREDRRTFSPVTSRPPATVRRPFRLRVLSPRRLLKRRRLSSVLSPRVGFSLPRAVLLCLRRQRRRETLFAKKKAGRGGLRPPRFNFWSTVSCRRK